MHLLENSIISKSNFNTNCVLSDTFKTSNILHIHKRFFGTEIFDR